MGEGQAPATHSAYRPEIDGLRSIAIVPVVLYHLGLMGGGFAGVDVFYVISGYLITGLLLKAEPFGVTAIAEFYSRRIRRLLPALSAVMLFVLIVAWLIYLPTDFRDVGRSAVATTLFSSNVLFWLRAGYFEPSALTKPLLHTWSLAVEEQFYVVFPLVVLLIRRMPVGGRMWVLGVLAAASLAFSCWAVTTYPVFAFYMLPTRAWELLAGALISAGGLTLRGRFGGIAATFGMLGLVALLILYQDDMAFPGPWAVPIVGCTVLVILGAQQGLARLVLASRPMVWIGKISYSWYLWHWPAIVFTKYYLMRDLTALEQAALFLGSLLVAYLSWRFLETPIRRLNVSRLRVFVAAAVTSLAFILVGYTIHARDGMPERFPTVTATPPGEEFYNAGSCFLHIRQPFSEWKPERCSFPAAAAGHSRVVLWGDSYAAHYMPGLRRLQATVPFDLSQVTAAGCPPFVEYTEANRPNCLGFNRGSLAWILSDRPDVVVYAVRWNRYRDRAMIYREASRAVSRLRAAGIEVLIIGESPVYAAPVPQIRQILTMRGQDATHLRTTNDFAANAILERVARETGSGFFSPQAALCIGATCRLEVPGGLAHWDEGHLSVYGSEFLAERMRGDLAQAIARAGEHHREPTSAPAP